MEPKIKTMKAEDPCICGSGRGWKKCCGAYLAKSECEVVRIDVTGTGPVRFFLGDVRTSEGYTGDGGDVLVFTSRAQALSLNERLHHRFQIVGMGQENWERFQREVPNHVVVADAVA